MTTEYLNYFIKQYQKKWNYTVEMSVHLAKISIHTVQMLYF